MSNEIRRANERQNRGIPPIDLCQDKIAFYSYKVEFWRPGCDAMSKAAYTECLQWWETQLQIAERQLVREISSSCPR